MAREEIAATAPRLHPLASGRTFARIVPRFLDHPRDTPYLS